MGEPHEVWIVVGAPVRQFVDQIPLGRNLVLLAKRDAPEQQREDAARVAASTAANLKQLTYGRYVGAETAEGDDEPFEEKMKQLTATLRQQHEEAARLDAGHRR